MFITSSKILELKSKIKIDDVISEFIVLEKKGKNFWSHCPFHDEKTPSFFINPDKGFYKCFGCGIYGDSISFIKKIKNINFLDSINYLSWKYEIKVCSSFDLINKNVKFLMYSILSFTSNYYINQLWNTNEGKIALKYCENRKIPIFFLKKFKIGYSQKKWDDFYKFSKEYNLKDLVKIGLVINKKNKKYDFFRERLMFPIHDLKGNILGFGGRLIQSKISKFKYINSLESFLYKKSNVLYGIYYAKKKIKKENNCFFSWRLYWCY